MKKSTRNTVAGLALVLPLDIAGIYWLEENAPGTPFEARAAFMAFIYLCFVWFVLTHRTPEGGLDPMSITGRKFW